MLGSHCLDSPLFASYEYMQFDLNIDSVDIHFVRRVFHKSP